MGCAQVDVWAVGGMLFQMLYGRRPFGEGCSQEEILREEVMLKAKAVAFPAKPAVSAECKDFITRCACGLHEGFARTGAVWTCGMLEGNQYNKNSACMHHEVLLCRVLGDGSWSNSPRAHALRSWCLGGAQVPGVQAAGQVGRAVGRGAPVPCHQAPAAGRLARACDKACLSMHGSCILTCRTVSSVSQWPPKQTGK